MKPIRPRRHRGVTLLEAAIALAVMASGLIALAGLHGTLRQQAELSRQRAEALQMAQGAIEAARRVTQVDDWAALADQTAQPDQAPAGTTTYTRTRQVIADATLPIKMLAAELRWADRSGQPQRLVLQGAVAGVPPALSGALALGTEASPLPRPRGRHPAIPAQAVDLGAGRSAFRPAPTVAWVFDNLTGRITGVCEGLAADAVLDAAAVAGCADNADAQLLSGHVRFLGRDDGVTQPKGVALNLDLQLALASAGHAAPGAQCFDDAPTLTAQAAPAQLVRYHCIVHANGQHRWSGRTAIVPRAFEDAAAPAWTLGSPYLVCRYRTGAQSASNAAHPADYVDVQGPLAHQNFLVVPADRGCPADAATDTITAQHQP